MVSVMNDGKYYIEPQTYASGVQITEDLSTRLVVNTGEQQCLEYQITSTLDDLVLTIWDLEGVSLVTIHPR